MSPKFIDVSSPGAGGVRGLRIGVIAVALFVLFLIGNPIAVIPAGHVGVKDFFGSVSSSILSP
ncbi:MAG TPA: hypothetical protein VLO07_08030, partial [Thermoanaerobaculia bacterium]|nr:hypothetical protein [Thermoanaerobaculia bacterium]